MHHRNILLHASTSHFTMYYLEPTQISQWKCTLRSAHRQQNKTRNSPGAYIYTVYRIYVYFIVVHFPCSCQKLFICMAVFLLTKMQFCIKAKSTLESAIYLRVNSTQSSIMTVIITHYYRTSYNARGLNWLPVPQSTGALATFQQLLDKW